MAISQIANIGREADTSSLLDVESVGVCDSFPLNGPPAIVGGFSRLLDLALAPDAPGAGWVMVEDRWHAARDGLDDVAGQVERVAMGEAGANDLDLVVVVDDVRLRAVLDACAAVIRERRGVQPYPYADVWPTKPFWVRFTVTTDAVAAGVRVNIRVALWSRPPLYLRPPGLDVASEPMPLADAVVLLDQFQLLMQELALVGELFDGAGPDVRSVFGARWLPAQSAVLIPASCAALGPREYLEGSLDELTRQACPVVFQRHDVHSANMAASVLQDTSLCIHRQFSTSATQQIYSVYLHLPVTDDLERFETEVDDLVAGFEALEAEVARELWDVSTDLEMVQTQFAVHSELAREGGDLVDALVIRLVDSDGAPVGAQRRLRGVRSRRMRARLRDSIELVRRTLLQTESEREQALSMVRGAVARTEDLKAVVRVEVDHAITRVPVTGFPTVTSSLLASEKFDLVERKIAEREAESAEDARLARLLETTTNVFVEERERTLEAVERNASLLNIALGLVALFTIVEFLIDVRSEPLGSPSSWIVRTAAALAGVTVLGLLARLWWRNRQDVSSHGGSVLPILHADVVAAMRILRLLAVERVEPAFDVWMVQRLAQLFDEVDERSAQAARLRAAFVARAVEAVGAVDEDVARLAERYSPVLGDFLAGRESGRDAVAEADLELLQLEASIWSSRLLLFGERPPQMYQTRLPATTALYFLHREGPLVSRFEAAFRIGDDRLTELERLRGMTATETAAELVEIVYSSG